MNPLFLLLATVGAQLTVAPCGGVMTITKISISPANPVPNGPLNLHLEYVAPTIITGGSAETSMTYNFMPFSPVVEPLCGSIPCPLAAGPYSNDTVTTWPTGLSGTVTSTTKWFDLDRLLLLCFKISGKVSNMLATLSKLNSGKLGGKLGGKRSDKFLAKLNSSALVPYKPACRNKTACFRSPR